MPFNEAETIKVTGAASLQTESRVKNEFARVVANPEPEGDPADLVEATSAEVHQYHKVMNYPAKTYTNGVFFLLSAQKAVIACSANTEELFGAAATTLVGKRFGELFQQSGKVDAALAADDLYAVTPVVVKSSGGASVNLVVQRGPNGTMVDVEPVGDEGEIESKIDAVKKAVGKFDTCSTEQELCDQLVWKFNQDNTSKVASEKVSAKVKNPLQGLTLYDVDMPPNAKVDFLQRTYSRCVVSANHEGVDLVTDPALITPEEISLKKSNLRKLHACGAGEFAAWNVKAVASFPVILQRRLWGICIHSNVDECRLPAFQVRLAMEWLVQAFTLRLAKLLDEELSAREEAYTAFAKAVTSQAAGGADESAKIKAFLDLSAEVGKAVPGVSAVAVYHKGKMAAAGSVSEGDAQKVVGKILEQWKPATKEATALESLAALSPELSGVAGGAGVVAVPLMQESVLLLFRPDANASVTFAGSSSVIYNRATGKMHARRDPNTPTPVKQTGKCAEWSSSDVDAAKALSSTLGAIVSGSPGPADGVEVVGMDAAATFEVAEKLRKLESRVGDLLKELKEK